MGAMGSGSKMTGILSFGSTDAVTTAEVGK